MQAWGTSHDIAIVPQFFQRKRSSSRKKALTNEDCHSATVVALLILQLWHSASDAFKGRPGCPWTSFSSSGSTKWFIAVVTASREVPHGVARHGVIALTAHPQSSTELWGSYFAMTGAAVQCCCITAKLDEEQIFIGVIAVTYACCQPVLQGSTYQWGVHFAKHSAAVS